MWVLRKVDENNLVHCIPLNESFTIGRIECSLTITDDKSVSRKHANITFLSAFKPVLTDHDSKFGTFVNGDRVSGTASLKSGDKIKFGGATSEFILELKDFSVFVKTKRSNYLASLRELGNRFGFEVNDENVKEAAYFILDEREGEYLDSDPDLIEALLLAKYIVSPAYFSQLNESCFSLALIQPSISSKRFPLDCWIPQRSRLATFKTIFDSIKRFILLETTSEGAVIDSVKTIANLLGIEVKVSSELSNLKFHELLIQSSSTANVAEMIESPIRTLEYKSIVDALLKNDGQLIEFQTVYPLKKHIKSGEPVIQESKNVPIEPIVRAAETKHKEIGTKTDSAAVTTKIPDPPELFEPVYTGSSLIGVIPMPSNYLRAPVNNPSDYSATSQSKPPKFVKVHPKHRQPGTIPALIGPDQLAASARAPAPLQQQQQQQSSMKRRVLVKDSWLAEDDFVEDEVPRKATTNIVASKENNVNRSIATVNVPSKPSAISEQPKTSNPTTPSTESTVTVSSTSTPNPTTTTAATASKFQSSLFKNLSNKQR